MTFNINEDRIDDLVNRISTFKGINSFTDKMTKLGPKGIQKLKETLMYVNYDLKTEKILFYKDISIEEADYIFMWTDFVLYLAICEFKERIEIIQNLKFS